MWKWLFVVVGIFIILGFLFYFWTESTMKNGVTPKGNGTNEYVIVLGAKVKENGEPSLSLKYRLDQTVEYLEKYPRVKAILSGGQGDDEPISEAEFMYLYLVNAGIDEERLTREDASTSTYENLLYSKELLPKYEKNVTILSSDFHLGRVKILAEKLDLQVDVVAAKTPRVVESKLRMRERFALLKTVVIGQ